MFHIIQLTMKAVHFTSITIQQTINNKHSRIYKLLKSNWQFFITDQSRIATMQPRWFKGINEYLYPQDAPHLIFGLSPKIKQDYKIYQAVLRAQQSRSFDAFSVILSQYEPSHSVMDPVILTCK